MLEDDINKNLVGYNGVSFEFVELFALMNKFFDRNNPRFKWDLDFKKNNVFYSSPDKVAIGKIKILDIIGMINSADNTKYNIFDDNVRTDQEDDSLQNDLKSTLEFNPERFFLFHNGVTVSCKTLETRNGEYLKLTDPQIINGCQSLKSLQKIYNDPNNDDLLKDSEILCRVFEGKNTNDVNAVCQSTNSQRPIYNWDLRANDLVQKVLQELLPENNLFYNRKKKKKKEGNKIYITDLAQWIHACVNEEPAAAKSSKKKLFDISCGDKSDYYLKIFKSNFPIQKVFGVCDNCIFVRDEIKKIKSKTSSKDKKSFLDNADFHIMAFVYKFGSKDSDSVRVAVKKCWQIVKDMRVEKEYSYNNIFKNSKTWSKLTSL